MGRYIQYDHSRVTGYRVDEKGLYHKKAEDDFIHLRQQDAILLACKRSMDMAACDKFDVDTKPATSRWVDDKIEGFSSMRALALPEMDW